MNSLFVFPVSSSGSQTLAVFDRKIYWFRLWTTCRKQSRGGELIDRVTDLFLHWEVTPLDRTAGWWDLNLRIDCFVSPHFSSDAAAGSSVSDGRPAPTSTGRPNVSGNNYTKPHHIITEFLSGQIDVDFLLRYIKRLQCPSGPRWKAQLAFSIMAH